MSQNRILRRSAEALDEADDLVRRMDVQIFQQQNGIDYSKKGWVPGDPIYTKPTTRFGRDNQYIRNLFDVFPLLQVVSRWEETDETGEVFECEIYFFGRCKTCDVDWVGAEPCWMCGERGTGQYEGYLNREMIYVHDENHPLDRWGFIAKPLTAREEAIEKDELFGELQPTRPNSEIPPRTLRDMRLSREERTPPRIPRSCRRYDCRTCDREQDAYISEALRQERTPMFVTMNYLDDPRMMNGREIPIFNLRLSDEASRQFPERLLDELRRQSQDYVWDDQLAYHVYKGIPQGVYRWFEDHMNHSRMFERSRLPEPVVMDIRWSDTSTEAARITTVAGRRDVVEPRIRRRDSNGIFTV